MEDMWRNRAKPTPLDYDGIKAGTFVIEHKRAGGVFQVNGGSSKQPSDGVAANGSAASGSAVTEKMLVDSPAASSSKTTTSARGLKDQRALTLQDNLDLFISRYMGAFADCPNMSDKSVVVRTALLHACRVAKIPFRLIRTTTIPLTSLQLRPTCVHRRTAFQERADGKSKVSLVRQLHLHAHGIRRVL